MFNPDKLFLRKIKNKNGNYIPAKNVSICKNVYQQKCVLFGQDAFLFEYPQDIFSWSQPNQVRNLAEKREEGLKRIDNISRSRQNLYMIAKCNEKAFNHKPVFLTLTFNPALFDEKIIQDRKLSMPYLQHMFRKLRRHGYDPKYIGIIERQKNKNIHYHLMIYNLPYLSITQWKKYWSHGSLDVKVLNDIKNVSAYFTKYMSKEFLDQDEKLLNTKLYFTSRGIKRPHTLYSNEDIQQIKNNCKTMQIISDKVGYNARKMYRIENIDKQTINNLLPQPERKKILDNVIPLEHEIF